VEKRKRRMERAKSESSNSSVTLQGNKGAVTE